MRPPATRSVTALERSAIAPAAPPAAARRALRLWLLLALAALAALALAASCGTQGCYERMTGPHAAHNAVQRIRKLREKGTAIILLPLAQVIPQPTNGLSTCLKRLSMAVK